MNYDLPIQGIVKTMLNYQNWMLNVRTELSKASLKLSCSKKTLQFVSFICDTFSVHTSAIFDNKNAYYGYVLNMTVNVHVQKS